MLKSRGGPASVTGTTKAAVEKFHGKGSWSEQNHPRAPAGSSSGGEFVASGGAGKVSPETQRQIQSYMKAIEGKGVSPAITAAAVNALIHAGKK